MCRHAAAVGPPVPASVLIEAPHGLHAQAYQARELLTGSVCADGYGVGWYDPDVRPEPGRYVTPVPIWSDMNAAGFLGLVHSTCIIAAVRNATVAGANTQANCAPYAAGRHLLSLNGWLDRFDDWREQHVDWVAPQRRRQVRGSTDSEWLFQALLTILDERDPEPGALANATKALLANVKAASDELGALAQLNLLVADGTQVVATRWSSQGPQNSLYLLRDGDRHPGSTIIASEPLDDDPGWQAVAESTIVVARPGAPPVRLRA